MTTYEQTAQAQAWVVSSIVGTAQAIALIGIPRFGIIFKDTFSRTKPSAYNNGGIFDLGVSDSGHTYSWTNWDSVFTEITSRLYVDGSLNIWDSGRTVEDSAYINEISSDQVSVSEIYLDFWNPTDSGSNLDIYVAGNNWRTGFGWNGDTTFWTDYGGNISGAIVDTWYTAHIRVNYPTDVAIKIWKRSDPEPDDTNFVSQGIHAPWGTPNGHFRFSYDWGTANVIYKIDNLIIEGMAPFVYNQSYGQAMASITLLPQNDTPVLGQAQASIWRLPQANTQVYSQALAWIGIVRVMTLWQDTFTRTTSTNTFGLPDYGTSYTLLNTSNYYPFSVDGSSFKVAGTGTTSGGFDWGLNKSFPVDFDFYWEEKFESTDHNGYSTSYYMARDMAVGSWSRGPYWYYSGQDSNLWLNGGFEFGSGAGSINLTSLGYNRWTWNAWRVRATGLTIQFKTWPVGSSEPSSWNMEMTSNNVQDATFGYLWFEPWLRPSTAPMNYYMDNFNLTAISAFPYNQGYGNAQADIVTSYTQSAQAQAILNQAMVTGQAQAWIFVSGMARYAQALTLISRELVEGFGLKLVQDGIASYYPMVTKWSAWQDLIGGDTLTPYSVSNITTNATDVSGINSPSYTATRFYYYYEYMSKASALQRFQGNQWSVEAWFKMPAGNNRWPIFSLYSATGPQHLTVGITGATVGSQGSFVTASHYYSGTTHIYGNSGTRIAGAWHQAVLTNNNGTFTLYVDNAQVAQWTAPLVTYNTFFLLYDSYSGLPSPSGDYYLTLDSVAVWDSTLSPNTINSHFIFNLPMQQWAQATAWINGLNYAQAAASIDGYVKPMWAQAQADIKTTYPIPGGWKGIFYDTFTDTNGVYLQNHTPELGSWNYSWGNNVQIQGGVATNPSGSNSAVNPNYVYSGSFDSWAIRFSYLVPADATITGPPILFHTLANANYEASFAQDTRTLYVGSLNYAIKDGGLGSYAIGGAAGSNAVRVKVEVHGLQPCHIQAKAWPDGTAEPDWQIDVSSSLRASISNVAYPLWIGTGSKIDEFRVEYYELGATSGGPLAQARTQVKGTYQGYAQTQARIKQTYPFGDGGGPFAQSVAFLRQPSFVWAQAAVRITGITPSYAQAQADIKQTYPIPASYENVVKADNPSGFWKLDDAGYPTAIATVGPDGSYDSDGITYRVFTGLGGISYGVLFSGASSYMNTNISSTASSDNFTFETWAIPSRNIVITGETRSGVTGNSTDGSSQNYLWYPNQMGGNRGVGVSVGLNGIQVYCHGDGNLYALASYSGTLSDTDFNHIVIVVENRTPRIYLNGTLVRVGLDQQTENAGRILYRPTYLAGQHSYGPYAGKAVGAALYPTVLSDGHIQLHYANRNNAYGSGPGEGSAPFAQALAWIGSFGYAQAAADIFKSYNQLAQAQGLIASNEGFLFTWNYGSAGGTNIWGLFTTSSVQRGPNWPYITPGTNVPIWFAVAKNTARVGQGGTYTFYATAIDDQVKVRVNGVDIFGGWIGGNNHTTTATIAEGQEVSVAVEWYSDNNWESLTLQYQKPASTGDTTWYALTDGVPPWMPKSFVSASAQAIAYISPSFNQPRFGLAIAQIAPDSTNTHIGYRKAVLDDLPALYYPMDEIGSWGRDYTYKYSGLTFPSGASQAIVYNVNAQNVRWIVIQSETGFTNTAGIGELEIYENGINIARPVANGGAGISYDASSYYNASYTPIKIVDGNSDGWAGADGYTRSQWLRVVFDTPRNIQSVKIINRPYASTIGTGSIYFGDRVPDYYATNQYGAGFPLHSILGRGEGIWNASYESFGLTSPSGEGTSIDWVSASGVTATVTLAGDPFLVNSNGSVRTYECWLRYDGVNDVALFVTGGNGSIYFYGGSWGFQTGSGDIYGLPIATSLQTGVWYHVAIVWYSGISVTDSRNKIYINGVNQTLSQQRFSSGAVTPSSTYLEIGGSASTRFSWGGGLDEFAVFNYELTAEQILTHYQSRIGLASGNAQAVSWHVDPNSGAYAKPIGWAQARAYIIGFGYYQCAQTQAWIQDAYGFTVLQNGVFRSEPGPQWPHLPNSIYYGFQASAAAFMPDVPGAWTFTASVDDSLSFYIDGVRILAGSGTAQADLDTSKTHTIAFTYGTDRGYPDYLTIQYQRPGETTWYYLTDGKPPWIRIPTNAVFAQARARIAGKVSWWKFDEVSGTNFVDSIDSNNLTQQTGSVTLNGDFIYFAGNAYLQKTSPNVPLGNAPRSVSVWYKGTSTSDHTVFSYGSTGTGMAFGLVINDGASGSNGWTGGPNTVGYILWAADYSWSVPTINNDEWHLIVLTYDGDHTLELYVDGSSQGSVITGATVNTVDGGSGIIVGRDFHQASAYLEGNLNDLILWDRVVASDEIAEMWGAGLLVKHAFAQAQAYIKGVVRNPAQAQAWIVSHPLAYAQAQVFIGWVRWAQANSWIKSHPSAIGWARADVKQTYGGFAQAQVFIGWVRWAQAAADIKAITQGIAQASLRIKATMYGMGQAQAILIRVGTGQASTTIKQTYPLFSRDINWATAAHGARVFASGSNPDNVIDEDYRTIWYVVEARNNPDGLPNSVITIDLGAWHTINGILILPVLYDATAVLQYSVDGQNWTTVKDLVWSGITGSRDVANTQEFQIAPVVSRYWRIQATSLDVDYYIFALASFEIGYYTVKSPTFAQATALVGQWGYGLAQAYISPAKGWKFGQAAADIINVIQQYGQAQAFVIKACMIGYAIADILATANIMGLANAWIIPPSMFAQAQATIKAYGIVQIGVATFRIKTWANNKTAMAKAMIHKFQGYSQAQAMIKMGRGHGMGLARMVLGHRQWAQAQAYILPTTGSAQARAFIVKYRWVFGQAQALITRHINNAQAMAIIKQTYTITWGGAQAVMNMGWGLSQAKANIEVISWGMGLAKADIEQTYSKAAQATLWIKTKYLKVYAHARADVRLRRFPTGLAMAHIGPFKLAQAQARILAFNVPRLAQAQGYILPDVTIIPPQPTSELYTYLVRFNGFDLPGYAQSENYDSQLNITQHYAAYVDASMSEDVGLQNKTITIKMRLWETTYAELKRKVQLAATILRSTRQFAPLFIQDYHHYYLALPQTMKVEKTVGTMVTVLDYEITFEVRPEIYDA